MTDWSDVALVLCIFLLIILFAGDPDLMDAIIAMILK